jgi:hypothetical protein
VAPAVVALLALAFLASASQARSNAPHSVLAAPTYASYITGVFHWSAVRKADHYEFQIAADKGFNSPVLGGAGSFQTWSTSATLPQTLQDGRYWWRVRSVRKSGATSRWVVHSFTKAWTAAPSLLSPANNASIAFPDQPLLLSWKPLLGSVRYSVAIARDAKMTSLVDGAQTITTATSYIPPSTLADGTYYWTVTPVDAENHDGTTSAVRSFNWSWPTSTQTTLQNLIQSPTDAQTTYDPLVSWNPVPGAVKYELDINFSQDFNPSSRVCCSSTTVATGYSPLKPLPNNTYFWRVRPINAQNANGVWTTGTSFTQYFDTIPPIAANTSTITNLHVRDDLSDGGPEPPGWSTSSPILVWDRVAGAAQYDLDVYTMRPDTGVCDIQWATQHALDLHVKTPLTAWTPLGSPGAPEPYPSSGTDVEKETSLTAGDHYCVRIRAVAESADNGQPIYGDYTYLPAPGTPSGSGAFTYSPTTAPGDIAMPQASDYLAPISGAVKSQTPLFAWKPIAGAKSYWVIVARDPSFTTLIDYGFTLDPAYAPRKTYADENTLDYWAVLPASNADGSGLPIDPETGQPVGPLDANAADFQKQSTPPTLISPQTNAVLAADKPKFQWTPVDGTLNYTLEVSTDPNFGTLLDNVTTASTAYVSTTTYPAQSTLYWRVQANDVNTNALTWSSTGTFKQVLPTPQALAQQVPTGGLIPAWSWAPVTGAIGYDVRVVYPGGSVNTYNNVPTPAMVPTQLSGTGAYSWQVRAEFIGNTVGPYSASKTFHRAVTPPSNRRAAVSQHALILQWQGRPGLKNYNVQISSTPDFSNTVEADQTDGTALASNLNTFRNGGGKFYWRVNAVDADGNVSGWSTRKSFKIHKTRAG